MTDTQYHVLVWIMFLCEAFGLALVALILLGLGVAVALAIVGAVQKWKEHGPKKENGLMKLSEGTEWGGPK